MQQNVKCPVHIALTTPLWPVGSVGIMRKPRKAPHAEPQAHRFHYIVEWAERRGLKQADITRELGADKSTVSRWFSGTIPSDQNLLALTHLLVGPDEEPVSLFRHPDDDWLARFFRNRSTDERARIRQTLEAAFGRAA
jgi:transcriptional regulator with XRE-family HTH domain